MADETIKVIVPSKDTCRWFKADSCKDQVITDCGIVIDHVYTMTGADASVMCGFCGKVRVEVTNYA